MSDTFWMFTFATARFLFRPTVWLLIGVMLLITAGSIHLVYRGSLIHDYQIYLKPAFTFKDTLVNLDTPEGISFVKNMPREEIGHLAKRFDVVEFLIKSGPQY